ncbi:MAG: hypothetical protein IKB08_05490, partial [Clostridia bacterium]|nr:hypothetical protein [Clostridia bacterium]
YACNISDAVIFIVFLFRNFICSVCNRRGERSDLCCCSSVCISICKFNCTVKIKVSVIAYDVNIKRLSGNSAEPVFYGIYIGICIEI